jgi:hypothetical protein
VLQKTSWVDDAHAALQRVATEAKSRTASKDAAVIERASHSRSSLGRFLRSKKGKRLSSGKRVTRYVSIPIDLDADIGAEVSELGDACSLSRFLLVLVALGAAQWPSYRALLFAGTRGEPAVPVPQLIQHILDTALNPEYKSDTKVTVPAWIREAHERVVALKPPSSNKPIDPTEAVLKGTGLK